MAGQWIKMRTDLHTDPAVMRLAAVLGADTFAVVGMLHAVWVWADTHADRHGRVTLVSRSCLDSITHRPGFGEALEAVGWLTSGAGEAGGITFPRFDRHMGEGAKARAQAAKRQQNKRAREAEGRNARVTPPSRNRRDNSVTREEESREEKKREENTPQPPAPAGGGVCDEPSEDGPGTGPKPAEVVAHWNAHPGLLPAVASDPSRDRMIRTWATGNPLWAMHWRAAIALMGRTPFYCGAGARNWRPSLSWLFKDSNFSGVVEQVLADAPKRAPPDRDPFASIKRIRAADAEESGPVYETLRKPKFKLAEEGTDGEADAA